MNYTENYQLNQWEESDRVLMEDFNADNEKIDAALAEIKAAEAMVKLLDLTLEEDTQKWDIDMSSIDLTQYQKLLLYPHLKGNTDQWVYMHINGLTSGYTSPNNATDYCGNIPMTNNTSRQNFGVCEFTFHLELPRIYVTQIGVTTPTSLPSFRGYTCPALGSGVTHLDTLNLWFDSSGYRILSGSTAQIYGIKR